jgi:ubiquinone biosynthesis protein
MSTAMDALGRLQRNARRVGEVAAVLAKHGLAEWLQWLKVDWVQDRLRGGDGLRLQGQSPEARVRLALSELGTTFIKLGQVLGTRPDLVGAALADELARLQAHTQPDPPEVARRTVQEELGRAPGVVFDRFDEVPCASASIAQVHRARLHTGEEVAVKVMRKGVREQAHADLEILLALARLAENHAEFLRPYQPVRLALQFRRTLLRELDFTHERRNLERLAEAFEADHTVTFPAVHPSLCTARVLVMEYLEGIPATDVAAMRASGADLATFARRGADLWLAMIFRDGFYHADPHPGNLLLMPDGSVGVLDCGMVGRIDEDLREDVESMLVAAVERDAEELADVVMRIGATPVGTDRQGLRADLARFLDDHVHHSLRDLDVGAALRDMFDIVRNHHVVLPASMSLLLRTCIVLEGTSRGMDRDFSLAQLAEPFYLQGMRKRMSPAMLFRRVRRTGRDWERLFAAMPRDLRLVLDHCREGTFRIQFEHRNLDGPANRLTLGILVAALVVSGAALWTSTAPPRLVGISVPGLLSYLLAAHLALRLWRATSRTRSPGEPRP